MPPSFEMPTLVSPDFLLPEALNEATERNGRALRLFARLKPGISIQQATAAMRLLEETLVLAPGPKRKFSFRSARGTGRFKMRGSRHGCCLARWEPSC